MGLFRNMQDDLNELYFLELSRVEQNRMLQALYNRGYSASAIAKKLSINTKTVYSRIDAHRGRGPTLQSV